MTEPNDDVLLMWFFPDGVSGRAVYEIREVSMVPPLGLPIDAYAETPRGYQVPRRIAEEFIAVSARSGELWSLISHAPRLTRVQVLVLTNGNQQATTEAAAVDADDDVLFMRVVPYKTGKRGEWQIRSVVEVPWSSPDRSEFVKGVRIRRAVAEEWFANQRRLDELWKVLGAAPQLKVQDLWVLGDPPAEGADPFSEGLW